MTGAPSAAPVSSRNEAMGAPLGVAPPPMRIRVPAASRSRRCDARRFDPVAAVPLISDSRALSSARSSALAMCGLTARTSRLQLAQCEGRKCRGNLGSDGRSVVEPASLDDIVELLYEYASSGDGGAGARDLLVSSRDVVVGRENRDSAASVAHFVLNVPLLCRDDDDAVLGNRVSDYGYETLRAPTLLIAFRYIGQICIHDDRDIGPRVRQPGLEDVRR